MASNTTVARKKRRNWKFWKNPNIRILFVLGLLFFGVGAILLRLIFIQIFESSEKHDIQMNQYIDEVSVTAERGNIYDRNMNVLVQDSSAKSVNIIPLSVEEPERVARVLSEKLGVEYDSVMAVTSQLEDDLTEISDRLFDETKAQALLTSLNNKEAYELINSSLYVRPDKVKDPDKDAAAIAAVLEAEPEEIKEKLTIKENSPQVIKHKVDNTLAVEIEDSLQVKDEDGQVTSSNGIKLLEDKKRYYTNGNFASYVLGFTGNDHEGLYGVEKTFDESLKGVNGIVYNQKDGQDNILTGQSQVAQEAVKGKDLVLSLDSNIQSAAEKGLEAAITEWEAKSGTCIVMNTKTGEIVAMTSKPDFNLNDPYVISDVYASKHAEDLDGLEKSEQQARMWQNPAVSFIYEPGSTFKPITVATALEEGAINPSMTFNCTGAITIAGTTINCTGVHGVQHIPETLENSCNPGLVQIIQDLDPNIFYRYVYNYGFGAPTGIELTGEESGIVNRVFDEEGNIKIVDYSTFSFGQGLATTPIQLITALNALINNGKYMSPTIIKDNVKESPEQIVSESTSSELRKDMQGVLENQPTLKALAGEEPMGGKTGTAEKFVNGEYSNEKYVTSFFCFAPVEDPIYSCILVLDEPKAGAAGSSSAAPYAIQVLKQAMIYSGSNPDSTAQADVLVPDCVGQELEEVTTILNERGITFTVNNNGQGTTVLTQSIPAQSTYKSSQNLILTVGTKPASNESVIPDFTGMSVQSVNDKVQELGMHLAIEGSGFAVEQSIAPGSPVEEDSKITVRFE